MKTVEETEFQNACQNLYDKAIQFDKDFKFKINKLADDIARLPSVMIAILENLDNGGCILVYLANNRNKYKEIYNLQLDEMRIKLVQLSAFLKHL